MSERYKDIWISAVSLIGYLILGILGYLSQVLGQFFLCFALVFHAYLLGRRFFPHQHALEQGGIGLVLFFALQSILQTAWFYLTGHIGGSSDLWIFVIVGISCLLLSSHVETDPVNSETVKTKHTTQRTRILLALLLSCSIGSCTYILLSAIHGRTLDSIRTPWPLLYPGTLVAIASAWGSVVLSIWLLAKPKLAALQTSLALLTTTLIVPIVYRLGFGFDGFLHVATEKLILASGTLQPKPLYYMGQYVFTTWLARTFDLPIASIDRWLVPVGCAILLPLILSLTATKERVRDWRPLFLILLPLSAFVATTPQSLAYLLGLAALLLISIPKNPVHPIVPLLFSTWSIAVHPLAGIPLSCVILAALLHQHSASKKIFALSLPLCVLSALSVPVLFFIISLKQATPITWHVQTIFQPEPWRAFLSSVTPWIGNRFVVWSAWSSLMTQALPLILCVSGIGAWIIDQSRRRLTGIILFSGLLLILSSTVLKQIGDFSFLIDYERGNYADRLFLLGTICLLVASFPALAWFMTRITRASPIISFAGFSCVLAVATGVAYNALPRHDALIVGRGWSVGQADIEAARSIDRDAGNDAYTVLANQSVSAAAVSQYGFKRYHDDTFYYPIPTGGPLYDLFLRMTYGQPSVDLIREAGALGGSQIVYVVLNDYWWNADVVAEDLRALANDSWSTGNTGALGHADQVFKFDLKHPMTAEAQPSGS